MVRVLPGLTLVAVLGGCGASSDELAGSARAGLGERSPVTAVVPAPAPTHSVTAHLTTPTPTAPPTPEAAEESATTARSAEAPVSAPGGHGVRIPRLGVTAPVVPITMSAQRVLEPPRDPAVLGWWSQGAPPGAASGSAVLVGHSVRTGGGALNELASLGGGDLIEVHGWGSTLTYRVVSAEVVSKSDLARRAEEIFNQSGPGRLVLITCEDWDGTTWRSNVVTVATPA